MSENLNDIEKEILNIRDKLRKANRAYYVDSVPIITDIEYDGFLNRLIKLEKQYPQFYDKNSPSLRIGSDIDNKLPEREHSYPILSLDKCYNFNDLNEWINKNKNKITEDIELIMEPKIDGAGVVLYYEDGRLDRALTRGNGYIGNEITENIKTIKSIPLIVNEKTSFAVRGEVYIKLNDFTNFNKKYAEGKYSNPRNLASGSVRRQKSKEAALFPLNIFIYEGFFENRKINNHHEILINLKKLGFPLNDYIGFFSDVNNNNILPFEKSFSGKISDIKNYINKITEIRKELEYEIDGLVIKINNIESRKTLGYTQHHPRWAIAYKFEAPYAETEIESIITQVGRGGRVTPVANLKPVKLAGSIISRATLHNQYYIDTLDVNIGDKVTISKRGDVIPAVEEVIEKGNNISAYKIEKNCPVCNRELLQDGAHLFCINDDCDGRLLGTLQYFVARDQMDIESLGDKTIEFLYYKGFIKYIPDIYTFDYNILINYEGFKEKKINNIISAVEKSKEKDFKIVLSSLGLRDVGNRVGELLVENYFNIDNIIKIAKNDNFMELVKIDGIGENIAKSIINQFKNKKVLDIVLKLKKAGLKFEYEKKDGINEEKKFLINTKWVITGSFKNYKPREKAGELIKKYGGETLSSISNKTTHLLCGENPGSKFEKAKKINVKIINEKEFNEIIKNEKL